MTGVVHEPSSALVARLIEEGALVLGDRLTEAFQRVDRGVFVPAFALHEETPQGARYRLLSGEDPGQREEWARHVYADETLTIEIAGEPVTDALPGGRGTGRWTSSSTMPSLMARMLHQLDLDGGPRVLEVGVGSGYNAAILCEVLGSDRVTSIDISPRLVSDAARRLSALGYTPVVAEYDGHRGFPDRASYDRIVSTTAFTHVPPEWITQVVPGGSILVNIAGGTGGAMLGLRVRDDHTAQGRFLPQWAGFMPARSSVPRRRVSVDDAGERSTTTLNPALVRGEPAMAFLAQLATTDADTVVRTAVTGADFLFMEGADGAWAEIDMDADEGRYPVVQGGPRRLWTRVEEAQRWWLANGQPDWSAFGVTVTPGDQHVWFGSAESDQRWPLPLP
ncbi:ATP-grasp peptide maturase system methyltransferase [Nocardiopsis sp. HUAS JQ3]|uniref:ATP-grasp peptide maturase system methyltransferase n=1 Tax=Nocardiopsis sp. HUAS JQ3 TaxID=3061629 RepID=UPI0023A9F1E9|nr:ATP-grasp peptide maturase system methyltransferase [Nocardiopsis sp. HUAS JQ3]WDZ91325.1 ATP-grasp peptide maturase system methyltransferase [Nocardiopsis sp. HUAS JQ3]